MAGGELPYSGTQAVDSALVSWLDTPLWSVGGRTQRPRETTLEFMLKPSDQPIGQAYEWF